MPRETLINPGRCHYGWVAQKNGAVFVLQRRFVFYGVFGRSKGLRKLELVDVFGKFFHVFGVVD